MLKQILRKKNFCLLIVISICFSGYSQENSEIEFGVYSIEDLKDSIYESDINAPAVILYECGEAYFNNYFEIEYKKHVRIKIFNKPGYNYANVRIPYRSDGYKEYINDIEAYTAYVNENGEIVQSELNSDDIFIDEVNKIYSFKIFTMPSLQPGCIVEYRYKMKTDYMSNFPKQWTFQHEIPVLWSEYKTEIPSFYRFAVFEQLTHPFFINEQEEYKRSYTVREENNLKIFINGFRKRMVMQNIPALREEPFMKSINDCLAKVTYQLASFNPPFSSAQKILQSWKELGENLMGFKNFGNRLNATSSIESAVNELIGNSTDSDEALNKIYKYLQNSFQWNKNYSMFASDLDDIFVQKKGDSGDLNLLLLSMLKAAGIQVFPVILSTRSFGTIYPDFPIADQFNHVIVYAKTKTGEFVLDVTDRQRPYYLLPFEALNSTGLMITNNNVNWVEIIPAGKDLSVKAASILIKNDGSLKGVMRLTDEDYAALSKRKRLGETGSSDDLLKKIVQSDKTGLNITPLNVLNYDNIENPLIIEADISSDSYSQVTDSMIYISPYFLGRLDENPFKTEERNFGIDYAYPIDHYYRVNITIPTGCQLKEFPKPVSLTLNNDGGGYVREIVVEGNTIQLSTRFYINKISFSQNEYQDLRKFYIEVISLESELLVLQKQNE